MQIKCTNCGEMNERNAKICGSCNQEINLTLVLREMHLQKYQTYSLVSLILGAIGLGIFSWLSLIFLNASNSNYMPF